MNQRSSDLKVPPFQSVESVIPNSNVYYCLKIREFCCTTKLCHILYASTEVSNLYFLYWKLWAIAIIYTSLQTFISTSPSGNRRNHWTFPLQQQLEIEIGSSRGDSAANKSCGKNGGWLKLPVVKYVCRLKKTVTAWMYSFSRYVWQAILLISDKLFFM